MKGLLYKTITVRHTAKNNGYHRLTMAKTLSLLRTWTLQLSFMREKLKTDASVI